MSSVFIMPMAVLTYWVTLSPKVKELLERFRLNNLYTCGFHQINDEIDHNLPQMSLVVYKGLFGVYLMGWPNPQLFVRVLNVRGTEIYREPVANIENAYVALQRGLEQLDIARVVAQRAN